jgi:agmatinase
VGVNLVGADVVEVAPSYDHAELTALAAANLVYDLVSLFTLAAGRRTAPSGTANGSARRTAG